MTGSVSPGSIPSDLTAVLIGVGDYRAPIGDLQGPANDVAALREVLQLRNPKWKVTTLLDKAATQKNIEATVLSSARSLVPAEPLLVYLSGHSVRGEGNTQYFLSHDSIWTEQLKTAMKIGTFIQQTLKEHPKSIFIIDGAFDPMQLPSDIVHAAAVMTAGDQESKVVETMTGGKFLGAFTEALVEALSSAPPTVPVDIKDLYVAVRSVLQRQYHSEPRLVAGPEAPSL